MLVLCVTAKILLYLSPALLAWALVYYGIRDYKG